MQMSCYCISIHSGISFSIIILFMYVQEKDLGNDMLKVLNSIVACGELPALFSNDEMDGLLQVSALRT